MSKLLNMLAQLNRPPENGAVPPGIRMEVARSVEKNRVRRRYLIGGVVSIGAIVLGLGLRLYFEQPDQAAGDRDRARALPPHAAPAAPGGRMAHGTGQPLQPAVNSAPAAQQQIPPTRSIARSSTPAAREPIRRLRTGPGHPEKAAAAPVPTGSDPGATLPAAALPPPIDKEARDVSLTAARSAEKRRAYSEALRLYLQALSHDYTNHALMNNAASMQLRLGDAGAALAMTDKALLRAPEYVPALINQGIARSALNNSGGAAESFARALALEPSNREAMFNLALFNEKAGKLDAATTVFQRLAANGDLQGMFGLARVYEKRAQRDEAIRVYAEITAMRDLPADARKTAAERLRQLRN